MSYVNSEGTDQTALLRSLVWAFAVHWYIQLYSMILQADKRIQWSKLSLSIYVFWNKNKDIVQAELMSKAFK